MPRTNGGVLAPTDAARARLAALVRSSADAIVGQTRTGIITDWNPAAERLYGYRAEEVIGQHLSTVIPADRLAEAEAILDRVHHGECVEGAETVHCTKDGRLIDVALTIAPVWVDGTPVAFSTIIRDLTERRRQERALQVSAAKYRALVEQLPAVIYEQANDERQTSTYFSPQFAALTGYSMAEIMDQPPDEHWHDFLHPDDRECVAADEARSVATGEPFRSEYRLRRRDGSYVWVRDDCVAVRDGAGEIIAWQGVLLDITDRVQAEQALAASETRFRTAFENAPIGMALTSSEQDVLQVNHALCAMLGYEADEIIAKSLRGLTHPDDISANRALIDRILAGECDSFELEKRYLHKDGRIVWAQLQVSLVRDERKMPLYYISQAQDITARKRAEEALQAALDAAQQASRAKSQFLAMMSHELRTPLQAVMGYAEVLLAGQGGTLPAQQREDIGYIHQGGSRMMALIGQMLDLSRIEAGALQVSRSPVDLLTILEQVRQDVALQAEAKGLVLTIAAAPNLPAVLGDALHLRQILLNLVSNAVKFTERGAVQVRAAAAEMGVTVTVRDTGLGIAPDALPHIFEEFRQVDSSLTRRHGGAGLGLAIAQKLAELMGSRITVESEVGVGSTFTLHLAAAPRAGERARTTARLTRSRPER